MGQGFCRLHTRVRPQMHAHTIHVRVHPRPVRSVDDHAPTSLATWPLAHNASPRHNVDDHNGRRRYGRPRVCVATSGHPAKCETFAHIPPRAATLVDARPKRLTWASTRHSPTMVAHVSEWPQFVGFQMREVFSHNRGRPQRACGLPRHRHGCPCLARG